MLMTLELSLSRAEVKRLAGRLVTSTRDQANYRTLTDIEAEKLVRLIFMMISQYRTFPPPPRPGVFGRVGVVE